MLEGLRVLVTRPRERAEQWIIALQEARAEVLYLPLFDLAPLESQERMAALTRIKEVSQGGQPWLAFTSVPAVHHFVQLLGSQESQTLQTQGVLDRFKVASIGKGTSQAAAESAIRVDWVATHANAESLARDLIKQVELPFELLHPTSDQGLKTLSEMVTAAGGSAEQLVVYRQVPLEIDGSSLFRGDEPPHVLTFASPSAVRQLLDGTTEEYRPQLFAMPTVAIGETTAEVMRDVGFERITVLPTPHAEALLIAVAQASGR